MKKSKKLLCIILTILLTSLSFGTVLAATHSCGGTIETRCTGWIYSQQCTESYISGFVIKQCVYAISTHGLQTKCSSCGTVISTGSHYNMEVGHDCGKPDWYSSCQGAGTLY